MRSNIVVLDLYEIEVNKVLKMFQSHLSSISKEEIIGFAKSIFPINTIPDCYKLLYHNISTFYTIRLNRNQQFSLINLELVKKAQMYSDEMFNSINNLYKNK